jgi:3-methyladenine DNA glycosylase AlkD
MTFEEVIRSLKKMANPRNVEGMARFGINPKKTLGISIYDLRALAKKIGKDHKLALRLWDSGIHEAKILASFVDEPEKVTEAQIERWVADFDSWDVCDQVCELFGKTPYAYKKIADWSNRKEEFVKRAAYALIAEMSWHDKEANDKTFIKLFPIIKKGATDERNYVRKAVNWALRNIGKRNKNLNKEAIKVAEEIQKIDSKAARWIAADALRELKRKKLKK